MGKESRTKTGCLTCRKRRKKCSETRPICTGCARNYLDCIWPHETSCTPTTEKWTNSIQILPAKEKSRRRPSSPVVTAFGPEEPSAASLESSLELSLDPLLSPPWEGKTVPRGQPNISWHPATTSFISPQRAVCLTSTSSLLYQHFVEETVIFLVAKPLSHNPFATCILPLSHSDDLLMHAVLALSGIHLSYQTNGEPGIQSVTRRHYSLLLLGLRRAFSDPALVEDRQRIWRLLLILMVLCHFEALSGDPHGGIFLHLRACRELILKILPEQETQSNRDVRFIKGFIIETYSYLTLVNSITPYGRYKARTLPIDDFVSSLGFLREYETYGVFIGCGQGLFEMIPRISILAAKRLAMEEESHPDYTEVEEEGRILLKSIREWSMPPVDPVMMAWESEREMTAEIYRQALLIYLKTTLCGSVIDNPKIIVDLQQHVDFVIAKGAIVSQTPFETILLWPIMMAGCCAVTEVQRERLKKHVETARIATAQIHQAGQVLDLLWQDTDKQAFGPYGLYRLMKNRDINISMA